MFQMEWLYDIANFPPARPASATGEALRREQRQRWPDPMRLQRLKKLKLAVKDRLRALTRTPRPAPLTR